jgi:hypothetical protein
LLLLAPVFSGTAVAGGHTVRIARGSVFVDGARLWRGRKVQSPPVWSESGDALAFTGRDLRGRSRLVVILVADAYEPATFSWPLPASARRARSVTWLGEGRVGVGPSQLDPQMVAEFSVDPAGVTSVSAR